MLYLLPNLLSEKKTEKQLLPSCLDEIMTSVDGLIAESEKESRRFLKHFRTKKKPHEMPVALYNEHSSEKGLDFLLEPMLKNEVWGLVSDAGLPCIADPGSRLVKRARQLNIPVCAIPGPSSIFMALMLSGMQGQRFSFMGYLAKEPEKRRKELIELEKRSKKDQATQIFIEAPYRNMHTFKTATEALNPRTRLAIGWRLTEAEEGFKEGSIEEWRRMPLPAVEKCPAIFLIFSE